MAWIDEIIRFVAFARKPDGSIEELRLDDAGNLKVTLANAPPEPVWDDSPGFVAQRVVKATPCALMFLSGVAETNAYLQVFDAKTLPKDGTKPTLAPLQIWWGWPFTLSLPPNGRAFKHGVVWAVSTTPESLTHDPTARAFVNAQRT